MLCFHLFYSDIRHSYEGRIVSSTRRSHITTKEIPEYYFLLETQWNKGLVKADRSIGHLNIYKTLSGRELKTSCLVAERQEYR
jgi:hypothetical protein